MKFTFGKLNTLLLLLGIIVIITGYIIMGTGDKTISPVLLVIAYAVIFPAAIIVGTRQKKDN
ncbi:MAG: hypothetical protein JXB60_01840 [Candidatus Cloacimonetes bacterium]|nr:hypothetical protein [Candidatus Cloacimonadota bacterium]